MIHLISIAGKSAGQFFLPPSTLSAFKTVIGAMTSGRVMIVSTGFRSDLFYKAPQSCSSAILKMWAFYAGTYMDDHREKDFAFVVGDEEALCCYFQSMNILSANWYYYNTYRKAFADACYGDRENPLAETLIQCDQHLINLACTKRVALTSIAPKTNASISKDNFALALNLMNHRNICN